MSFRGYFVSDEAEKAAKWDAFEEYRQAKQRLFALETVMTKLGKSLDGFAYAIQHPKEHKFLVNVEDVTVAKQLQQGAVVHVTKADLDWNAVSNLISDYQTTFARVQELAPNFRDTA